ncbi:DedA family protein [Sphingomonas sp. PAMC26645]|uniref:DedA family protein n=1 Tax=Sphingomonas sp. PAMC26645 TaxID=2565555 RepID=UPI00109DD48E|nr:DedA family protein [Sphingomonas sp. PAMC26645]QCB44168.1 DedA family protein [Sphingomonas sp. PAMC26645]
MAFIVRHALWAGPVMGVLAFCESLAVVGLFIPATALMMAVGGMIATGLLSPWPIVSCAIIGAVLGDWLSFVIGRSIGPSALRRWPLNRHRHAAARARLFFRRYGMASILFGRFLGPIRATVPLVAGLIGMPLRSFQIANITSALIWVPALLAPGFLAAQSLGGRGAITNTHVLLFGAAIAVMTVAGGIIGARAIGSDAGRRDRRRIARTARKPS